MRYISFWPSIDIEECQNHLREIALTIAGSDSSTGAGVQGDLKTFSALGVYACTVITAITAQNTREIVSVTALDSKVISQQISCILHDISPNAIKIGMIHNISAIKARERAEVSQMLNNLGSDHVHDQ